MNCSIFEQKLSEYLEGELDREDAVLFRRHALQCRDCRRLMDDVKIAIYDCHSQEDVQSSPHLDAVLVTIPTEQALFDCKGFEETITEFLDGYVPAAIYHRFEQHAAVCVACSELLTDVVYAVAACHSVHTYEEYETSARLVNRLSAIMPASRTSPLAQLANRLSSIAAFLIPRRTEGAPWSFATASILILAFLVLLMFNFTGELTVKGIVREAHVKAAEIYSEGSDIYAKKDEIVGRLEEVRWGIGEVWETLGGTPEPDGRNSNADRRVSPGEPDSDVQRNGS